MNEFLHTFFVLLFNALYIAIFGRIIMSWIDPQAQMRVTQILHEVTAPILIPLRRIVPSVGMFDFSPMIALLLLSLLRSLILNAL